MIFIEKTLFLILRIHFKLPISMKKLILYSLSLFLLLFHTSCNKTRQYNPDDLMVTLNINVDLSTSAEYFLVVENTESKPQIYPLTGNYSAEINRGKDIIGSSVNLHFILLNNQDVSIKSFYIVPLGKTINISSANLKSSKRTQTDVQLSFSNTPTFDVISRNAKTQTQAYTQNTFETPATTAEQGGESFQSNEFFYACFQNGDQASYKLERIPDQSTYTIDFSDMKSNMQKHSFSKNIDGANLVQANIKVWDNAIRSGIPTGLFNLTNPDIFPASNFDFFSPAVERYFSYYQQDFEYKTETQSFYNWSYATSIQDEIELLNAGLKVKTQIGQLPVIESDEALYSIAEISFKTAGFSWTLYGPNTSDFYLPNIPNDIFKELNDIDNLASLFLKLESGHIRLIDYTPFKDYEDAIGLYFGSDQNKLVAGTSYRTQEQNFQLR